MTTTAYEPQTTPGTDEPGAPPPAAGCCDTTLPPPQTTLTARSVGVALRAVDAALLTLCGGLSTDAHTARTDPRALCAACRLDDLPELLESVLHVPPDRLDTFTVALVVWALDHSGARDIALTQWSDDRAAGQQALRAQLRWERGAAGPADLDERLWGEGTAPDQHRLARAQALAGHCAFLAPPSRQAGALASCAWLAWARGKDDVAADYARRACEREPEHGLGEIVRSFTAIGHRPPWAAHTRDRIAHPNAARGLPANDTARGFPANDTACARGAGDHCLQAGAA